MWQEHSESAKEQIIALYKSDQQQHDEGMFVLLSTIKQEDVDNGNAEREKKSCNTLCQCGKLRVHARW